MAFCFKRKEAVRKAIRRVAGERIDEAIGSLKDCQEAEAVHSARKDIKKVRAVLKLARPSIRKKAYRRQKELLKKAADRLSSARDAYVKAAALNQLNEHFPGELPGKVLRDLRDQLEGELKRERKRFSENHSSGTVKRVLRRVPKEMARSKFCARGWEAICPGVEKAYTRGLRGYQTVRNHPSPDELHKWRKTTKELWYQLRLLAPIRPEEMELMSQDLEALTESLGDDHDLHLLRDVIENSAAREQRREVQHLVRLIERRQRQLRLEALEIGARFYSESPARFCNRLARFWRAWRHGKKLRKGRSAQVKAP